MAKRGPKTVQTADLPLSRFLRSWLDEHELAREKAAARWGISHGTLRNLEAGIDISTGRSYKPKLHTLRQLAAGMGVPLDTLLSLQSADAEPPVVLPMAPNEPATVGAIADLLERKVLGLYGGHLAMSREGLGEISSLLRKVDADLQEVSRVHGSELGPEERQRLQVQTDAVQRHLQRLLQPLESFTDGLGALLPAIEDKVEQDVVVLSRQLVARIKASLLMQVQWDDNRRVQPAAEEKPAMYVVGPTLEAMDTAEGRIVPLRRRERPKAPIDITGRLSAGPGYYTDDEFVEETIDSDDSKGADYAMRVAGDSLLEAGIFEGDILFLVHSDTAKPGDLVAVWSAQKGRTVKYLHYENGKPWLVPANVKYSKIPMTRDFRIKAIVTRVRRELRRH